MLLLTVVALEASSPTGSAAVRVTPLDGARGQRGAGFERLEASSTGITFTNRLSAEDAAKNQILLNGSGVAAGDFDRDGWVDFFVASLQGGGRLYRNLGRWRFADVTAQAGLSLSDLILTGATFADVDGDGDLDLLVNSVGGGTRLLRNDGAGHFTADLAAGLVAARGATSMALADVDGDGDLDLYIANYRTNTIRSTGFSVFNVNGRRMVRPEDRDRLEYLPDGRILEHGEPDILYLNDGHGRFAPLSWTEGRFRDEAGKPLSAPPLDWSLSVAFRDLNGDGSPDLYVCGDFHSPDRVWLNDGHGTFQAAGPFTMRNSPTFSMSVDFADLDQNGAVDFFVADMLDPRREFRVVQSTGTMAIPGDFETLTSRPQLARNVLQLGRGDGTFAEAAYFAGLEALGWAWSVVFVDVDLDGLDDLLATTGQQFDTQDQDAQERIDAAGPYRVDQIPGKLLRYPSLDSPKRAFRNLGGLRFSDQAKAWGWDDEPGVWQGVCLADLDNDGDLDVVVNRLNGPVGIYRNLAVAPRLAVRLKGRAPNTRGIGARLELHGGPQPHQVQVMSAGGRYLSGDDDERVFATGTSSNGLSLEVFWPGGGRTQVLEVQPNQRYEVEEDQASKASGSPAVAAPPAAPTLFVDESARLGYRHFDAPFDDFARQPLLSRRHSQAGPGVGWIDLDGDGREDLFIASGKGGRPGIFLNAGQGTFRLVEPDPAPQDQIGVVGIVTGGLGPGAVQAWVACTAYEGEEPARSEIRGYDSTGASSTVIPLDGTSVGALAAADVDGDGDLDLFVGGSAVRGRYPEATASRLFERSGDRWQSSVSNTAALAGAGLVNGARWTDLDGDGYPELVLACEWGPVRVFRNQRGTLREATQELGLGKTTGWWTGVSSGDFDEDGRLDLVIGNWGLNSQYRPTPEHPVRLYYGDLSGQGQVDLVDASYDAELGGWAPDRDLRSLSRSLPWLRASFPTHRSYARATAEAVLIHSQSPPRIAEAAGLASLVLLNRGDHFQPVPLPTEAQLAPVFGIDVADFDLDGHLDLFLAQNFFAVSPAISRHDAGRGLVLLGNGQGGFRPLEGLQSGIRIYGEQRGSACGDYDLDGRPDLVVTQNCGETKLYRNTTPRSGMRIRLRGPRGNPHGIGAVLTVRSQEPLLAGVREIHSGSGYASQSAPLVCVPFATGSLTCDVRWPGGALSHHVLSPRPGVREIQLAAPERSHP